MSELKNKKVLLVITGGIAAYKSLELITSEINLLNTEKYHLSIEIGLDNFAYTLLDIDNLKYKALFNHDIESNLDVKKIIQNISEIYNKEKLFKKNSRQNL